MTTLVKTKFGYLVLQIVWFLPDMVFMKDKFHFCLYFLLIVYDAIKHDRIFEKYSY